MNLILIRMILVFEIGSGFSGNSDYMKALDEKKRRALMEEQYNFLQIQKSEILTQQKYRELHQKGNTCSTEIPRRAT